MEGGTTGIMVSASQYNLTDKIIDLCTFDVTNNPLRCGELFDAILTDPPCACFVFFTAFELKLISKLRWRESRR